MRLSKFLLPAVTISAFPIKQFAQNAVESSRYFRDCNPNKVSFKTTDFSDSHSKAIQHGKLWIENENEPNWQGFEHALVPLGHDSYDLQREINICNRDEATKGVSSVLGPILTVQTAKIEISKAKENGEKALREFAETLKLQNSNPALKESSQYKNPAQLISAKFAEFIKKTNAQEEPQLDNGELNFDFNSNPFLGKISENNGVPSVPTEKDVKSSTTKDFVLKEKSPTYFQELASLTEGPVPISFLEYNKEVENVRTMQRQRQVQRKLNRATRPHNSTHHRQTPSQRLFKKTKRKTSPKVSV